MRVLVPDAVGAPVDQSPELVAEVDIRVAAERRAQMRDLLARSKTEFLDITFEKAGETVITPDMIIGTYQVPVGAVAVIDRIAFFFAEPFSCSDINFRLLIQDGEGASTQNFGSLGCFASGSLTEPMKVGPIYVQASERIQVIATPLVIANYAYQSRILIRLAGSLLFPGALSG